MLIEGREGAVLFLIVSRWTRYDFVDPDNAGEWRRGRRRRRQYPIEPTGNLFPVEKEK